MDTGAVIAIVVGALILLLLLAWALPRMRERKNEQLRSQAGEERYAARDRQLRADKAQAAADEKAARARREAAQAEERAREATHQREAAGEHMERARELDPDVDEDVDVHDDDRAHEPRADNGALDDRDRREREQV